MATRRAAPRALVLGLGVAACGWAVAQPDEAATYVGIESNARDQSRARLFASSGRALGTLPLDFRIHGMAAHGDLLAVFPRRPAIVVRWWRWAL